MRVHLECMSMLSRGRANPPVFAEHVCWACKMLVTHATAVPACTCHCIIITIVHRSCH